MKFDDVLEKIGGFGRAQKILYFLVGLPSFPASIELVLLLVFTFALPDHRCAIPGFENDTYAIQGEFHERLVNFTIPMVTGHYGQSEYSECQLRNDTSFQLSGWNQTVGLTQRVNSSDALSRFPTPLMSGSNLSDPVLNTTVSCDKWVYDKSRYISTIPQTMGFVCERKWYISVSKMMVMIGQLAGVLITGPLSDKFGRRPLILAHMVLMYAVSIAMTWVRSTPLLLFVVFVYGFCGTSRYLVCFIYGMELVAPSKRRWAAMMINFFWSAANLLSALAAFLFREWDIRQLIVSVPVIVFVYLYFIPESPRWLWIHGRTTEAKRVVNKLAKGNKVDISPSILDSVREENTNREPFWSLVKSPVLLKRLFLLGFNWLAAGMGFYGLTMNVTNLSGDIYLNFFLYSLVELAAYFFCIAFLDRLGRKPLLCGTMFATGIICMLPLIPVLVSERPNKWAINVFAIVGNTCASAAMAIVYTSTAELLPTTARNSGMGFCSVCARIGSIISPYVADLTLYASGRFGQILPMLVFGSVIITAGLMALVLPETTKLELPETVADAEKLGTRLSNKLQDTSSPTELVKLNQGSTDPTKDDFTTELSIS